MTSITAPSGQRLQAFSYDDFQGIDSSRDLSSLDTGSQQRLAVLKNGYANFRGIILRDRGVSARTTTPGDRLVNHVTFFGRDLLAWAQQDGGGTTLKAEPNGVEAREVYPKNSIVTSTVFSNKLVFFSRGEKMQHYDGLSFKESTNDRERPAFGVAIQRRLAIAGGPGRSTIVDFSRVDDTNVFTRDESETDTAVTKAADIDIRNIIGTSDEITGLGVFEKSRIAVFTNDQCLVYQISPDFTRWAIDDKASVGVGTISHNSIANAGTDLLFCSRSGVHSLRRSDNNGITIYAVPLSAQIEELYKELLRTVENHQDISAYFDQDYGQYHVFFPQTSTRTVRLTLSISPTGEVANKWSTADYLNQRCGVSLGGVTCIGTSGGVFNIKEYEDTSVTQTPDLEVVTPILWHGSITETKQAREFILQASGEGKIIIDAYNQEGKLFNSFTVDLDSPKYENDDYTFLPLSKQYNRPFVHQYKGVQFRMRTVGGFGRIKIIGFAVQVEVDVATKRNQGNR